MGGTSAHLETLVAGKDDTRIAMAPIRPYGHRVSGVARGTGRHIAVIAAEPTVVFFDRFLWDSCLEEHAKDVVERPVAKHVMDAVFGAGTWTALPCLCHIQACGKKRRIDNAKAQLANAATRYVERFRLASAFAPAIAARALQQAASELTLSSADEEKLLHLESGGEDMPDAFRSIPIQRSHRKHDNVMLRHPQSRHTCSRP